ncbi:hypothetical protein K466DRAFT_503603 [Polyporus arcularius HHB13444]|uniref:BTB domain-containing protein n=1 Tax=Polyporus arcularius HHB13444 TaxID=1314778 RepID=A0A5C3NSX5_9APHY|nr:hypothetical protein K466DRAFT_503603 [Polyporus arcularius HHB13444]
MSASPPQAGRTSFSRHPHYYFEDGNLYIMVDDVLFNVHRSVFLATARLLHEHVPTWMGRSEHQPLYLRNISPRHFCKFLSLIYPQSVDETFTAEDWISVLEQSQKWGCSHIYAVAIAKLQSTAMEDALRIATWKRFGLDESQIARCYHAFGTRTQPISLAEGELMGMAMAMRLSALRDTVHQGVLQYLQEHTKGEHAGQVMGMQVDRLRDLVCRGLLVEFMRG